MKTLILILSCSFGFSTAAAEIPQGLGSFQLEDSEIGKVEIRVVNTGHTSHVLKIFVLCNDNRSLKNAVSPKWEELPRPDEEVPVCMHWPKRNSIDPGSKVLTVHYSTFIILRSGQNECSEDFIQASGYNLAKWCAPWRN
jgi:hypothetical protein